MLVRSCFFYLSSVPYLDQEDFQTEQEISLFLLHQVSFSYARVLPSYHIYLLNRLVVLASVELSSICKRSLGKLITSNTLKIEKKCTKILFFFFEFLCLLQSVNSCITGFIDIFGQVCLQKCLLQTSREFEPWIWRGEYRPFLRSVTAFGRTKVGTQILIDQLKTNIDTV